MITPGADLKVYVATRPVDFRNYADGTIMLKSAAVGGISPLFGSRLA